MHYKRWYARRHVRCTLCTPHRLGNAKKIKSRAMLLAPSIEAGLSEYEAEEDGVRLSYEVPLQPFDDGYDDDPWMREDWQDDYEACLPRWARGAMSEENGMRATRRP